MRRALTGGLALVLLAVLFLAVNVLVNTLWSGIRIDLTENKLYTLSEGSRQTLRAIREPVTLRFFYSQGLARNYPQVRAYADRVRDVLREYEAQAQGKVRLQIIDPEPYTEAEDEAVRLGLQGAQTDTGDRLYFGLVGTNAVGERESIPYFLREREPFLEYDLTRLIHRLSGPKKPVVAVLTSLPMAGEEGGMAALMGGGSQSYMVYELLRKDFDVRKLDTRLDRIDPAADLLLIVHPPKLDPATLYAIDQFALRGGRILAFVDSYFEGGKGGGLFGQGPPAQSDLGPLLQAWGVRYDSAKVVGDRALAQRVNTTIEGRQEVIVFPPWIAIGKEQLSRDDPVSADLDTINLASAGFLSPAKGATTTASPLIQTTNQADVIETGKLQAVGDPVALLRNFRPTGERYVLAARISGPANSAFPGGPPPAEKPETATDEQPAPTSKPKEPLPAHLAKSTSGINVIVIADVDLLQDQWWTQPAEMLGQRIAVPTADNANLVLNAVENLSGSSALIALRGRGQVNRPFAVIQDLQRRAEMRFRAEEQRLRARIADIQDRLKDFQQQAPAQGQAVIGLQEEQEVRRFEADLLRTRAALRHVQLNLRQDVESLETWIRFVNFGLMPVLVAIAALVIALVRRQRRRARVRARRA